MAANSEVVRGRDPVRLPAWVVIGVALALAGALAVVSTSQGDTTTAPASDSATVTERGSTGVRTDVEMAGLKAAVAQRFWAEQHATQESAAEPQISYSADNGAPVIIDGTICGQCR